MKILADYKDAIKTGGITEAELLKFGLIAPTPSASSLSNVQSLRIKTSKHGNIEGGFSMSCVQEFGGISERRVIATSEHTWETSEFATWRAADYWLWLIAEASARSRHQALQD